MWRAFFFAVGYLLIFLGVQSLVFERVQLSPKAKIPRFVRRIFQEPSTEPAQARVAQSAGQNLLAPAGLPSFGTSSQSGLGYGPSRFSGGGVGGNSFTAAPYRNYVTGESGALGIGSGQALSVPRVDLTSYGSTASPAATPAVGGANSGTRVIEAQDWMPWSLLASGLVVVLYTRSFGGRNYSSDS